MADTKHDVIVYSTPLCGPCQALKHYLAAHDVAFIEKDVMQDEAAADRLDDLGVRTTPALEVDGHVYAGAQLTREKVDALLDI